MKYHIPVLLSESIGGLEIKPNGIYVDLTFGGGGHSKEILKKLDKGKLIVFDQDSDAQNNIINDDRLIFVHHNFKYFRNFLKYYGYKQVDGILADLGLSSHHINKAERGFSFRFDANLDMRMNNLSEFSATNLVNEYSEEDLANVFFKYGDLRNSRKISRLIIDYRENKSINTIADLTESLKQVTPKFNEHKFLAKIFQALRIEVNKEVEALEEMLNQTEKSLKPGGRLVVITYHSIEDKLVKNYIKTGNTEGKLEKDFYGNINSPFKIINRKVIVPSEEELKINNRARSGKLRIAEKK